MNSKNYSIVSNGLIDRRLTTHVFECVCVFVCIQLIVDVSKIIRKNINDDNKNNCADTRKTDK